MSTKDGPLYFARREHAKVVQSELADSHDFRFASHLTIMPSYFIVVGGGVMWVSSYGCEDDTRVRLRQRECKPARGEVAARVDDASNASFKSRGDHGFAVIVEAGGIDMSVAIDEQTACPFQLAKRERYDCGFPFPVRRFSSIANAGRGCQISRLARLSTTVSSSE